MDFTGKPAVYMLLKALAREDDAQINLGQGWTCNLKNEAAKGVGYMEMLYNQTRLQELSKVVRFPCATASIDRFIIGNLSFDTQRDSFVAQLNSIGLPRLLAIMDASPAATQ